MADDKKKKHQSSGQALVVAISAAVEKGLTNSFRSFADEQRKSNEKVAKAIESISSSQEELVKGLHAMAAGTIDAASVDEDEVDLDAARASNPSDASDATMASAGASSASDATDGTDATGFGDATDATDATDVDAGIDPTNFTSDKQGEDAEPGNLNPKSSSRYQEQSKGPASSQIQKTGSTGPSRGIAASRDRGVLVAKSMAAAKVIRTLTAQNQNLKEDNRRFKNRISALEASVERYAERVERRTITPEIASLLEKSGHDVRELMASKQRLTVAEVDDMFLKSGVQLEPTMRAAFKNQLLQAGLMEQGEVRRWN